MSDSEKQQQQPEELNWPLIGETVRMVQLSGGQINMAMHEGNESVSVLSDSFIAMMAATKEIEVIARKAGFDDDSEIIDHCRSVSGKMQGSIVAFQFYDKLAQRMEHVVDGMGWLSDLISDQKRVHENAEWIGLQGRIRKSYSMKEEQDMFDALLNGASLDEALELGRNALIHDQENDEVELF